MHASLRTDEDVLVHVCNMYVHVRVRLSLAVFVCTSAHM